MILFDLHTHNNDADGMFSILNSYGYIAGRNISIGIHPWSIDGNWKNVFAEIEKQATNRNVRAIGECGIDKIRSTASIEEQQKIFKAHAMLAERTHKPLVIHCVKGFDEIIAIHKEISPEQTWIIHGFRGKPQQAEQLIKSGFCISYGEKFNTDSVKATPLEKLFIESDESKTGINDIYTTVAKAKGCSIEELGTAIERNAKRCNFL